MYNTDVTLHDFLGWEEVQLTEGQLSTLRNSQAIANAKQFILSKANLLKWTETETFVKEQVGKMLQDISLVSVLAGAWCKARQLRQYRDAEKYPPNATAFVSLVEHPISSVHKPYIEIAVSNQAGLQATFKIHFEIAIKLTLEAAVLTIQGGKIKEIGSASGKIKGEIKIEGKEFWKKETKSFAFPGTIHLGDGEAIEGEAADAEGRAPIETQRVVMRKPSVI